MTKPKGDDTNECDCCHFSTDDLTEYESGPGERTKGSRWLCELCAGTSAGTYQKYAHTDHDTSEVLKTICYVGNVILKALKS